METLKKPREWIRKRIYQNILIYYGIYLWNHFQNINGRWIYHSSPKTLKKLGSALGNHKIFSRWCFIRNLRDGIIQWNGYLYACTIQKKKKILMPYTIKRSKPLEEPLTLTKAEVPLTLTRCSMATWICSWSSSHLASSVWIWHLKLINKLKVEGSSTVITNIYFINQIHEETFFEVFFLFNEFLPCEKWHLHFELLHIINLWPLITMYSFIFVYAGDTLD